MFGEVDSPKFKCFIRTTISGELLATVTVASSAEDPARVTPTEAVHRNK